MKKQYKKTKIAIIGALILGAVPASYYAGGYRLVDSHLSSVVKSDTDKLVENQYTGSVKENVSTKDVSSIQNKIKWIHNKDLKAKLINRTRSILEQAQLQAKTKDAINNYYQKTDVTKVKVIEVSKLISDARNILNQEVKVSILRDGATVLDRVSRTSDAVRAVNDLTNKTSYTDDDLVSYYTAKALTDSAYGKSTKKELNKKLERVKSKLDSTLTKQDNASREAVQKQADKIRNSNPTYTGGSNKVQITKMSATEFAAHEILDDAPHQYALIVSGNKLVAYTTSSGNVVQKGSYSIVKNNKFNASSPVDSTGLNNKTIVSSTTDSNDDDDIEDDTDSSSDSSSSSSDSSSSSIENTTTQVLSFGNLMISSTELNSSDSYLELSKSDFDSLSAMISSDKSVIRSLQ